MRKLFVAVLALAGASSLITVPARVFAQAQSDEGIVVETLPESRGVTRAARLRSSQLPHPGNDPDTVWIGHIDDAAYTAGGKMPAGGAGPYHVGRGPNFPTRSGGTIGDNGTWSFDRFQAGETDSLFGWWPANKPYQSTGSAVVNDFERAFFGLDYGNQVNYVLNSGRIATPGDAGYLSPRRTFGVVGVWHRDHGNLVGGTVPVDSTGTTTSAGPAIPWYVNTISNPAVPSTYGVNVQPVTWSPTTLGGPGSTASAWMGVRSHGDNTEKDELANGGTGNPFNAALFQYQGSNNSNLASSSQANGTDHNFPGYGGQMDQMLYRDVQLNAGDGLSLSFNYSTNMSKGINSTTASRCGWFDKDPVSPAATGVWDPNVPGGQTPTNDGNFISSSLAGTNAPCDSFMVYIGAPVNDLNVKFSGTLTVGGFPITTVYDKKRRWFSEVIRCVNSDNHYKELLSAAGNNLASFSVAIPSSDAVLSDIKAVSGNKVRIVFRVKTNRQFDDENGGNTGAPYSSDTRGAAIIDNVSATGQAGTGWDFEAANSIDNNTGTDAALAWKSTGKPPPVYWHKRALAGSYFTDPCGDVDNPLRGCNMYGNVVTPGDHDDAEHQTGQYGGNNWERGKWLVSPTVNLVSTGNGPGFYNGQGIDDEIARATGNYTSFFSIFTGGLVLGSTVTGNFISVHYQSYPARQKNGNIGWGECISNGSISSYGAPRQCGETFFIGAKSNNVIKTTNPAQRPDSLRYYIFAFTRCFGQFIAEATCGTIVGPNVGYYLDNMSLAIIDSPPPPTITLSIWNVLQDAFPMNTNFVVGEAFDTTGAQIRNGLNNAPNAPRSAITGDSAIISAAGNATRIDMIFRIKPGPGNFVSTGHMSSGIAKTPNGKVAAVAGDGSFFGTYMQHNGFFGSGPSQLSGDPAGGPGHVGGWDINLWNSARCDTAERNLFPTANNTNQVGISAGTYAAMYAEGDPNGQGPGVGDIDNQRFNNATFNVPRVRCVMPIPTGATNSANITCAGLAANWTAYTAASSGWDGSLTTKEFKKIIPDGLLTPGSHVEYFFRHCDLGATSIFNMAPDTNFVTPQNSETGNTDGHRWQEFSVLPDRWKDNAWAANERDATAPACMLFVDWQDRRGDERIWVGIADTIGASIGQYNGFGYPTGRWGAHNGWHARGDQNINGVSVSTDPTIAVYAHGGQPGSIWDMFGVKASESTTTGSSIGSRSAAATTGFLVGQQNKNGPTGDMLRQWYRILFATTGDLDVGPIGPYTGRTDNDILLLTDFADDSKPGTSVPRAVWFIGRNYMHGEAGLHPTFTPIFFGASLVDDDYRNAAGNSNDFIDLIPNAPVVTTGAIYGVNNFCTITNDWLTTAGTGGSAVAAKYADTNAGPNPKAASIYTPATGASTHSHVSLVDGYRMTSLGSRNSGSFTQAASSLGRIDYFAQLFKVTGLFGSLGCSAANAGAPVGVGDSPNNALVYFLALRSENPFRSGAAKITFGIIRKERVELKVYDVTGRLVKTLANRDFEAGSHDLFWDGTNDEGALVSRGVYFYQVRTPSFVSQKKLVVLKN